MQPRASAAFDIAGQVYNAARIIEDPAAWQRVLTAAHEQRLPVACCCTDQRPQMVVYKRGIFHVRRAPRGGPQHAPDCRSHAVVEELCELEEGTELRYPESHLVRASSLLNDIPREVTGRRPRERAAVPRASSLAEIFDRAWQRAGLRAWRPASKPAPWRAVASRLHATAGEIRIGASGLDTRLVLVAYDGEPLPLASRAQVQSGARRSVFLALGPVGSVKRTSRDILISLWGGESLWCENEGVLAAYHAVQSRVAALDSGYVVGIFAVYYERNWRCHDWAFASVTHAWHPFVRPEQAELYEELVAGHRSFTIPIEREGAAPWAIVRDAEGGPRAVLPDKLDHSVRTRLAQWRWIPGRLPPAASSAMS